MFGFELEIRDVDTDMRDATNRESLYHLAVLLVAGSAKHLTPVAIRAPGST